ncbi:unnamed protein product [Linum tenue]|uniref:Uncharacterized protein n=1 Tax=Linum tenue TaxID=586396 RepID=A0AAV0JXK1_9ROSI|nr:unnamed protein product [Linum tenue]
MSILHSFGERLVLYLRTAPCHAKILQNCQPKPDPISRIHRPIVFSFFIACLVSLSLSLDLGNQRSESSIPWGLCLATCLLLTHITSANFGHPILRLHPLDMDSALCKIRTRKMTPATYHPTHGRTLPPPDQGSRMHGTFLLKGI